MGLVATFSSRLWVRLLSLLLLGIILACGILTFLIVKRERLVLMELHLKTSSLLADSLTRNIREAMVGRDHSIVRRMLDNQNKSEGVKAAVLRGDGSLAFGEMVHGIPPDAITASKATFLELKDGLLFLSPLLNDRECHACHNPAERLRGVVAVKMSTEGVKKIVDETAGHMAIFAVLVALLSGVGLVLMLKRMVLAPLAAIKDGALRIRDGDLSHRIVMEGNDELGTLAVSFNQMAEEIEEAQKGLEDVVNRLSHEKRNDIQNLIRLHDISIERIKSLSLHELYASLVSVAASFANADASLLWLVKDGKTLSLQDSSAGDMHLVPPALLIEDSFPGKAVIENRPIETVNTADITCLKDLIDAHEFRYAASVPLEEKNSIIGCLTLFKKNDSLMTDSERAIIALFATQAASAITTARIHEELKDQKELSDAIFHRVASGVMVLDRTGTVLRINPSGLEILHRPASDLDGKKITEIYPETKELLSVGTAPGREVTITLDDGTKRPVGFSNSVLFDKNGTEKGIIIVFRDLTEIKELQTEVRRKQHFEAMGRIISGVAHEVRNPLFAIQSITQILEREVESAQHQKLIGALLKETHRMNNLIEELLVYSRPSRLNIREVEVEPLLAEIRDYVRAKDRDAVITTSIPFPAVVRADRDKLIQVFLNLANNSLGAGGKRIDIAVRRNQSTLSVFITDNGAGIEEGDIDRVFDPFFTTKREGTGLGLPICRKIIEDHGGTLQLQSTKGEGTTAILTLKT